MSEGVVVTYQISNEGSNENGGGCLVGTAVVSHSCHEDGKDMRLPEECDGDDDPSDCVGVSDVHKGGKVRSVRPGTVEGGVDG